MNGSDLNISAEVLPHRQRPEPNSSKNKSESLGLTFFLTSYGPAGAFSSGTISNNDGRRKRDAQKVRSSESSCGIPRVRRLFCHGG